jgi:ubiquitin thioesterase OTU1
MNQADTCTLADCQIKDGDQLIAEKSGSSAPSTTPATGMVLSYNKKATSANINPEIVPVSQGFILVRQMKDDNSCLFRSIGYVLNRDAETSTNLRQVVVDSIRSDAFTYTDAMLGRDRNEYISWISNPNSW